MKIATRQKPFDEKVWKGVTGLLQDPKNLQAQIEKQFPQESKVLQYAKDTQSKVEKKLAKLECQEKHLLDAYREEIINLEELREQKAKIAKDRDA